MFKYYDFFPLSTSFSNVRSTTKEFPLEVIIGEDYYKVRAVVPGITADKIDINIESGQLTISADIKDQNQLQENESIFLNEIQYGKHKSTVKFQELIDKDNTKASLSNGILELYLPKYKGTSHRIEIEEK